MIVELRRVPPGGYRNHTAFDSDYDADTAFFQPATTITVHHL